MKVHVYDTHVTTQNGQYLHFDVLVNDENINRVQEFAEEYLQSLGVTASDIRQGTCNFCHSEMAAIEVQSRIKKQGYSVIRLS